MKKLCALALTLFASQAMADGRELATKKFTELGTLTGSSIAAEDYVPVYDASDRAVKKVAASAFPGGVYDASAIATSAELTGNPLQQVRTGVLTLAEVNAGTNILNSATSKTIYPGNWQLMASGAAGGATGVTIRCRGSDNVISSVPIAFLLDGIPVGPFKSATASPIILASALTRGCPSGNAVYISTTGTLTTTTHLYYSFPYTVQ